MKSDLAMQKKYEHMHSMKQITSLKSATQKFCRLKWRTKLMEFVQGTRNKFEILFCYTDLLVLCLFREGWLRMTKLINVERRGSDHDQF